MATPKIIAFYLPQYHPTEDNNKWWGKGFTEWTNVCRAKPLFHGHIQPKIPSELGYYDLRLPQVREQQAQLAQEAGIYGFCYYHYWFGNGKMELELPFNEVLHSGKPKFPFMLCWANESWHKKFWSKDGKGSSKETLIEQTYPGDKDIEEHFYHVLPAFKDSRYIRLNNKPVFMIYSPADYKNRKCFIEQWQRLAKENGLEGITFMCQLRWYISKDLCKSLLDEGFEYINSVRLWDVLGPRRGIFERLSIRLKRHVFNHPYYVDLRKNYRKLFLPLDRETYMLPTLIPNWDHTPRSGAAGSVLTHATPKLFEKQADYILSESKDKPFVFLKSWNEWGEGNYMEPDIINERGYIEALKRAIERELKES